MLSDGRLVMSSSARSKGQSSNWDRVGQEQASSNWKGAVSFFLVFLLPGAKAKAQTGICQEQACSNWKCAVPFFLWEFGQEQSKLELEVCCSFLPLARSRASSNWNPRFRLPPTVLLFSPQRQSGLNSVVVSARLDAEARCGGLFMED